MFTLLLTRVSLCPLLSLYPQNSYLTLKQKVHEPEPGSFLTSACPVCLVTTIQMMRPSINQITSSRKERSHLSSSFKKNHTSKCPFMTQSSTRDCHHLHHSMASNCHVEWSEELLTYLSVTTTMSLFPFLQAVTGHKNVVTKKGLQ